LGIAGVTNEGGAANGLAIAIPNDGALFGSDSDLKSRGASRTARRFRLSMVFHPSPHQQKPQDFSCPKTRP
jgi:hypothetical protein